MGNKLYVGNLPYGVRDNDLEQAFSQFGAVTSARVMMERDTGRSKGFGFVEMGSDAEAQAAVQGMNGQPLGGRSLAIIPWQMAWVGRLMKILPNPLFDRLLVGRNRKHRHSKNP